jgi:hypothetical protein
MTEQNNQDEKLYAGKFKTVEELEAGYKNSAIIYDENQNLKTKVSELSTIPENYLNPSDVELDQNRIADIQARAKETGMTQAQYEKFVRSDKARVDKNKESFVNMKKEVGEQTLNILTDYVSKNYPKELQENMLNTFIVNKDARTAALNHRTQLLNNNIPGMNRPAQTNYNVTQDDVDKAYAVKEKDPHNLEKRKAYLNLLNARGAQKQAS